MDLIPTAEYCLVFVVLDGETGHKLTRSNEAGDGYMLFRCGTGKPQIKTLVGWVILPLLSTKNKARELVLQYSTR
jgi:hypothetical protein